MSHKITPFLWFDTEAEEAARFYCSLFKGAKLGKIQRLSDVPGPEGMSALVDGCGPHGTVHPVNCQPRMVTGESNLGTRIQLEGLTVEEVARYLELATGRRLSDALVDRIHRLQEVRELLHVPGVDRGLRRVADVGRRVRQVVVLLVDVEPGERREAPRPRPLE